jgi:toxin ParE1/3/4
MLVSLGNEAQADADEAIDWYIAEGAPAAAEDFVNELEHALNLLRRFPNVGHNGLRRTRILPLQSFAYSLVYRVLPDRVRVIAVAHHSRRPGYWAGRR